MSKTNKNGAPVVEGTYYIDPSGHLCQLRRAPVSNESRGKALKSGWRLATPAEVKAGHGVPDAPAEPPSKK